MSPEEVRVHGEVERPEGVEGFCPGQRSGAQEGVRTHSSETQPFGETRCDYWPGHTHALTQPCPVYDSDAGTGGASTTETRQTLGGFVTHNIFNRQNMLHGF